ncbi:hypothetical protein KEM54_001876 [Ascosphaera aggregata]|nr:hypothetical protein KEM54_001876 [Ascosphaera aggregata]
MPGTQSKNIDIVVLGATGYTGARTAEYITRSFPTTLRWAVAGRSYEKLRDLVERLKRINPDRKIPGIIPVRMNTEELKKLACKTRILINLIGPYSLYSAPIVEACAKNGTHYVDITGEVSWVHEMIEKHHETAQSTNAILISCCGMDSVPADCLAYLLARILHTKYSVHPQRITSCVYDIKSVPSGGTSASILSEVSRSDLNLFTNSGGPHRLSATPPAHPPTKGWVETIFGIKSEKELGTLTTYPMAICDDAIVNRSISLEPELYGMTNFSQHLAVRNPIVGSLIHLGVVVGALILKFPPAKYLARKMMFGPGGGADADAAAHDFVELRAVAVGEQSVEVDGKTEIKEVRAQGRYRYNGDLYYMTGLLASEAARTLLEDEQLVKELGGGYLTPAMLKEGYIDRMREAGCIFETQIVERQDRSE